MKASAKNIYRSGISTKNGKQIKRMVKSGATVIGMGLTMTQGIQIDPNVPEMILMNPFFNREKRFKNTSSAVDQYTLTEADWYDQGHYASGLIANRTFVMSQVQQAGIRAMPVVDTSPIIDGLFESEGDWWTRQFAE